VRLIALILILLGPFAAQAATPDDVRRIMADRDTWMPADYTRQLKKIEAIGPAAAPTLLLMLQESPDGKANGIGFLCDALERVPNGEVVFELEAFLSHDIWTVRSSCGSAVARIHTTLQSPVWHLSPITEVVLTDPACSVRKNVAHHVGGVHSPVLRTWSEATLFAEQVNKCDRAVAMYVLAGGPIEARIGDRMAELLGDVRLPTPIRESAAIALREYAYPGAAPTLRKVIAEANLGGNIRFLTVQALGKVGTREDLPLLRQVIREDPYNGKGVQAVRAREAIAAIEASGR